MLAVERQKLIMESIGRDRSVLVSDLSTRYGVSEETIRRDLLKLEKSGQISRTYGGAVLAAKDDPEDLPYPTRQITNIAEKRTLAAVAASLVSEGDAVMIDSSSTSFEVLPQMSQARDVTIITNSVRILASSASAPHTVISVGGELRHRSLTLASQIAIDNIQRFAADICFISCKALSLEKGVMDASLADAELKRAFIMASRRVCLLADHSKFDQTGLIAVCDLSQVDTLITDRAPPKDWREAAEAAGVELLFPQ